MANVSAAGALLRSSARPLVVTGKGAALSPGAEDEVSDDPWGPSLVRLSPSCLSHQLSGPSPFLMSSLLALMHDVYLPTSLLQVRALVNGFGLPVLGTSMGRGMVPDNHPLCVNAAR